MSRFFIFMAMFHSYSTFACDCSPSSSYERNVHQAYKYSDLVVFGTVKYVNDQKGIAVFEVLESYKGDVGDTLIIKAISSCSLYLENEETWLLYLDNTNEGLISDQCLPNRLFSKMNILSFPPPFQDSGRMEDSYLRSILLYQELISFRQRRFINQEKGLFKDEALSDRFEWIIFIGVFFILLLIFLLARRR